MTGTIQSGNPVACRRASNAMYLQALLDAAGIEQSRIVRLPDDEDEIARALERRDGIDLIVSIGGTGRGTHDLTRRAIAAAGGTVIDGTGDVKGSCLPTSAARRSSAFPAIRSEPS